LRHFGTGDTQQSFYSTQQNKTYFVLGNQYLNNDKIGAPARTDSLDARHRQSSLVSPQVFADAEASEI